MSWLSKQTKRDAPIGDLATDVARDPDFPKGSYEEVKAYLSRKGQHVREALAEAHAEWLRSQREARSAPRVLPLCPSPTCQGIIEQPAVKLWATVAGDVAAILCQHCGTVLGVVRGHDDRPSDD